MIIFSFIFIDMKLKSIQVIILLAAFALVGLLSIQVYWFQKAFGLEEKQFHEKVTLALRSVANQLLAVQEDKSSPIPPVTQVASNQFTMKLNTPVMYEEVYVLLKEHFSYYDIPQPYQLALQKAEAPRLMLGGLVLLPDTPQFPIPCLTREVIPATYEVSITFPDKELYLAEGMQVWYGTGLTFLVVLFFFSYTAIITLKEKKLSAMKRDFINNMTHELKTPLASISLASEVLCKPSPNMDAARTVHYASLIYQETQRLQHQVEQVLQTARLEKGALELKLTLLDAHRLIEEVLETIGVRMQQRAGQLHTELKAQSSRVMADAHHFKNMLYNLLDNAEKYSPERPQIKVMTYNQAGQLVISIGDRGMGMTPGVQQYIFDAFYRGQKGNVQANQGFGLGLNYVKVLMKAHRGHVQVKSKAGEGSLFSLSFPCVAV